MGDLKLTEDEFFYIAGRTDLAAEAREARNDSKSTHWFGAALFCAGVIWQLYIEQDDIETWEEYDKKRKQTRVAFALSIAGPAVMLTNWVFQPANHAPMAVAVQAAQEYNRQLPRE